MGYIECQPVTSLGNNANKLSKIQINTLLSVFGGKNTVVNDGCVWMKKIIE